eukprot:1158186-Pelagomonas_calceolata.AAC.7
MQGEHWRGTVVARPLGCDRVPGLVMALWAEDVRECVCVCARVQLCVVCACARVRVHARVCPAITQECKPHHQRHHHAALHVLHHMMAAVFCRVETACCFMLSQPYQPVSGPMALAMWRLPCFAVPGAIDPCGVGAAELCGVVVAVLRGVDAAVLPCRIEAAASGTEADAVLSGVKDSRNWRLRRWSPLPDTALGAPPPSPCPLPSLLPLPAEGAGALAAGLGLPWVVLCCAVLLGSGVDVP